MIVHLSYYTALGLDTVVFTVCAHISISNSGHREIFTKGFIVSRISFSALVLGSTQHNTTQQQQLLRRSYGCSCSWGVLLCCVQSCYVSVLFSVLCSIMCCVLYCVVLSCAMLCCGVCCVLSCQNCDYIMGRRS